MTVARSATLLGPWVGPCDGSRQRKGVVPLQFGAHYQLLHREIDRKEGMNDTRPG